MAEVWEDRTKRRSICTALACKRQQIQDPAGDSERYGAFHATTQQHQRPKGHHGADDKVAGYEATNHLVQVRDELSRIYGI
jgi:hypothetical protein